MAAPENRKGDWPWRMMIAWVIISTLIADQHLLPELEVGRSEACLTVKNATRWAPGPHCNHHNNHLILRVLRAVFRTSYNYSNWWSLKGAFRPNGHFVTRYWQISVLHLIPGLLMKTYNFWQRSLSKHLMNHHFGNWHFHVADSSGHLEFEFGFESNWMSLIWVVWGVSSSTQVD